MSIVVLLVAVLIIPVLIYCAHDTSRLTWGTIHDGPRPARASAYRVHHDATPIRWIEGGPPWIIRIAAFTSFCLGQMIIPAIPAATFFIVLSVARALEGPVDPVLIGLGISMPSAIMVALRVLGAGIGLLQRGPHAASQARSAARWELGHNLALSGFLLAFLCFGDPTGDERAFYGLLASLGLVAILHAALLFRAASALDAHDVAAEASEPASISA